MKWKHKKENKQLFWICEHGILHPDEDSLEFNGKLKEHKCDCDGCCKRDDFPGKHLGLKETFKNVQK